MKTYKTWLAVCVSGLMGCSSVVADVEDGDVDPPNAGVSQALTAFSFDSAALATSPKALLPAVRLSRESLTETNISTRLLATTEKPQIASVEGTRTFYKTTGWEWEKDSTTGRITGHSLARIGPAVALRPETLQKASLDRLKSFGIGGEEVGRVLQRQVLAQDTDGDVVGRPTLHSHKTFIFRAVNGIPVAGHRAVISHAADGSVRKILTTWPPLAKSGHTLRTALTPEAIQTRAAAALAKEGETTGKVFMSWRYLPQLNADGEVTLKLVASARMKGAVEPDGTSEEARIVDIDVDAIQ